MLGFQAFQSEVSGFMDELFNEEVFDREMNTSGKHWDYIPTVPDSVVDAVIDDGDATAQIGAGTQPAIGSGTQAQVATAPAAIGRAIHFPDDVASMNKQDMARRFDADDWVAFDEVSGQRLAFPKSYTRDKCRAAFQRHTGIPYNNVRCQTIGWYTR
jgi:hypothetical protein